MNIGIIGQGFVGNAVYLKFKSFYNVLTYDLNTQLCNSNIDEIRSKCKVIFICVPTPMNKDGSCDFSIVESVIDNFSNLKDVILVNKSTVTPGTSDYLSKKYSKVDIVFNPEFITEKNAVDDYSKQERIILGGSKPIVDFLKNIFSNVFPNSNIILTDLIHAEMIKYFTNLFLATKISFANEMFQLCAKLNINYDNVVKCVLEDRRIGNSHFSVPGHDGDFGFGGHCFPKDLGAIIHLTTNLGTVNNVLCSVKKTNDELRTNRNWEQMIGRAINK